MIRSRIEMFRRVSNVSVNKMEMHKETNRNQMKYGLVVAAFIFMCGCK